MSARDRMRRDMSSSRFDAGVDAGVSATSKRGDNPPSRHLWVGNLSHSLVEADLADQFLRFGELESIAFQPGRSYAFINFVSDEDAIAAIKSLQGVHLDGNPLRIEFAKADKSSTQPRHEEYLQRRDERSMLRGSPFSQRDSRVRSASPDPYYPDKSRTTDKNAEPSEVLWIGFPALLKVDEMILRKVFSPFGEIEKITVFPGRSYAFVRFRSIMSASRAKETLSGKLFGNPRVHICFAKSEPGLSNTGKTPLSPPFKSNVRPGASDYFRQDRNSGSLSAEHNIRSPHSTDPEDFDVYSFRRKGSLYSGGSNSIDNWRFSEELGPPSEVYERRASPSRERGAPLHEFVQQQFPRMGQPYKESWDLPEDSYLFHGAKKLKTGSFPPDKELPEHPFSDLEMDKRSFPRAISDFSQPEVFDNNFEEGHYGYKPIEERPINSSLSRGERNNLGKTSYELRAGSNSLPSYSVERKSFNPEPEKPSLNLWKWEGTIAKGGTPVCRARCFPVGKILDIMLPEFLDCTARTGLDMLAKHYFQAASAWVVFFSPAGDGDIGYYNEFMHYLGEKQRAAVAKLDDKNTLFLVPPSDFSKKVLKVPGELSISGVVLRLENSVLNSGSLHHPNENRDGNLMTLHGDIPYSKPLTPSAFAGSTHAVASMVDSYNEEGHDYRPQQRNLMMGPNRSPHHSLNIVSGNRNIPSQGGSSAFVDPSGQENHSVVRRSVQEQGSTHYASGMSSNLSNGNSQLTLQETKSSVPSSLPIGGLQPQQLAQLASSILGQQRQQRSSTSGSSSDDMKQANAMNHSEDPSRIAQTNNLQNNPVHSEIPTSQFGQFQQLQQHQQTPNVHTTLPSSIQREPQARPQGAGTQEDAEADPQKRLQATLQLAAALLQQIQQGK